MDEEASCKVMAEKDKVNQDNSEGMTSSTDHLMEDEYEKKFKALLETEKVLIQQLDQHEVASDKLMRKLLRDSEKNDEKLRTLLLGGLKERKFDETLLKLKEEQKALRKRITAQKLHMGALKIAHLKDLIKAMKDIAVEGDMKDKKLIDEMTAFLSEAEVDLETWKFE